MFCAKQTGDSTSPYPRKRRTMGCIGCNGRDVLWPSTLGIWVIFGVQQPPRRLSLNTLNPKHTA